MIINETLSSYDDKLLEKGRKYTIGTNDGITFKRVKFVGSKLLNGKQVMSFKTEDDRQLTINQSFHTFTLEELTNE
jgi:hypothetical protein